MDIKLSSLQITPDVLALISEIDEFKGAWRALGQIAPEQLTALRKVAAIESIGSSTRIEGSKLSDKEVEILLGNLSIQKFTSRDEQEVAGYSAVMNLIFQSFEYIPISENYIQQLHAELLQYSEKDNWHRGRYKKSNNHIEAFDTKGKSLGVVFETATPFETGLRMEALINWTQQSFEKKQLYPLLVVGAFVVEFLAIYPFQDGNGRLSRILTTWLLLRSGYAYVPYCSLEAIIEQNKEGYYLSLRQTQGTLKNEAPNWQPWITFFLNALAKQKNKLETKLEQEKLVMIQLPPLALQILSIAKSRGKITVREIVTLTNANRNTVKKHLESLTADNHLQQHGTGRGTWYTLA